MDYKKAFDIGMLIFDGVIRAKKIYEEFKCDEIPRRQNESSDGEQHIFNKRGVCIICGCSERFVEYFGSKCTTKTAKQATESSHTKLQVFNKAQQHVFNEEGVCIICGCSERFAKNKCRSELI